MINIIFFICENRRKNKQFCIIYLRSLLRTANIGNIFFNDKTHAYKKIEGNLFLTQMASK